MHLHCSVLSLIYKPQYHHKQSLSSTRFLQLSEYSRGNLSLIPYFYSAAPISPLAVAILWANPLFGLPPFGRCACWSSVGNTGICRRQLTLSFEVSGSTGETCSSLKRYVRVMSGILRLLTKAEASIRFLGKFVAIPSLWLIDTLAFLRSMRCTAATAREDFAMKNTFAVLGLLGNQELYGRRNSRSLTI